MAKLNVDLQDKTKEAVQEAANKSSKSLKKYVMEKLGVAKIEYTK
jgi:predicted HicB family RNase H-like nuclease